MSHTIWPYLFPFTEPAVPKEVSASLNSTVWTVLAFMGVQGQDSPFLRQFVLVLLLLQRAKLANIARGLSGLLHACAGC